MGAGDVFGVAASIPAARAQPAAIARPSRRTLQQLMPLGRIWTREIDANLTALLDASSREYDRVQSEAGQLLVESNPATANNLLPDWELFVGLPSTGTLSQRQAALAGKVGNEPGQSVPFYTALALKLGYTIEITGFTCMLCTSTCISPCADPIWAYVWEVTALHGANDALLMQVFQDITQAHTFVFFTFT